MKFSACLLFCLFALVACSITSVRADPAAGLHLPNLPHLVQSEVYFQTAPIVSSALAISEFGLNVTYKIVSMGAAPVAPYHRHWVAAALITQSSWEKLDLTKPNSELARDDILDAIVATTEVQVVADGLDAAEILEDASHPAQPLTPGGSPPSPFHSVVIPAIGSSFTVFLTTGTAHLKFKLPLHFAHPERYILTVFLSPRDVDGPNYEQLLRNTYDTRSVNPILVL